MLHTMHWHCNKSKNLLKISILDIKSKDHFKTNLMSNTKIICDIDKIYLISHNSPYIGIQKLNGCNLRCWPPPVNLSLIQKNVLKR